MKRTPTSLIALGAATAALALAGCGGGDEDSTSAGAGTQGDTTTAQDQPKQGRAKQDKGSSTGKTAQQQDGAGDGADTTVTTPPISFAPQEGSTTAAPGVTTVKGGDNSVQNYGVESSADERTRVAIIVQAYLNARAAEQWAKACSYLMKPIRAGLERFGGQAQRQGRDPSVPDSCAGVLKALTASVPAGALRSSSTIDEVLSFRVDGEQGFLLFEGPPRATLYSVPMRLEGGEWKVGSLIPNPLPV